MPRCLSAAYRRERLHTVGPSERLERRDSQRASEVSIDETVLRSFCREHGIRSLRPFGSAARNELRHDSDTDLLVELELGRTPGLLGVAKLELELQERAHRDVNPTPQGPPPQESDPASNGSRPSPAHGRPSSLPLGHCPRKMDGTGIATLPPIPTLHPSPSRGTTMTTTEVRPDRPNDHPWMRAHPVWAFIATTYALSWSLWLVAWILTEPLGFNQWVGGVPFIAGGLGPAAAAMLVVRWTGGSVRAWARPILRWRVPLRYYAYALGIPAGLQVFANGVLVLLDEPVEPALLAERWPAYLATFLFVLTLGGALEEPGWRGFALPRLQRRFTPVVATALLGLAWGIWHVPFAGPLGFVVPFVLAFFYTWLYNRTGSVLLCILLHASFTPAQDHLLLLAEETHGVTDMAMGLAYLLGAGALIVLTRGRLGYEVETDAVESLRAPSRT